MLTNCKVCKKEIRASPSMNRKYCSYSCHNVDRRNSRKTLECKPCKKKFVVSKGSKRKFCSHQCYWKWLRDSGVRKGKNNPAFKGDPVRKICNICNKEFFISCSRNQERKVKYCSSKCFGKSMLGNKNNLGKKRTKESRKRISEAHKGYKMPDAQKKKIAEAHKGEKSHFWKGGITKKNSLERQNLEYKLWRKAVFIRDDFTCQKCNNRGRVLHPHHIQGFAEYPELRFAIDNGITFCRKCHKKFHKIYGNGNNTREQVEEFLIKKYGSTSNAIKKNIAIKKGK